MNQCISKSGKGETVFVFGSNESGIHGAGAARVAVQHYGAVYGVGYGHQGNSFAVPTKDWEIQTLPFDVVKVYIERFIRYATLNPEMTFHVTRLGCGLAGFKDEQIAPLFINAPANCLFDEQWEFWLPSKTFWGSF